ncbi:hypothetical protein ACSBLW_17825 [Thioclava sp. FR2]|uniref:hypothetical protein n=1 Tax=Thioclava sp. FR2 TaxID=3445780 RepID=UPI003EB8C6FA
MVTEFTGIDLIAWLLKKFLFEFAVGSIGLFILTLFFDVGLHLTGSLASVIFGAPLVLLVAATLTLYLPFSIIVGLLLGALGRKDTAERRMTLWYAAACIGYICIGLFVAGFDSGSIAIGVSLILGNVAYLLLCLQKQA